MIRCRECGAVLSAKLLVCAECSSLIPKDAERVSPFEDDGAVGKPDAVTPDLPGSEVQFADRRRVPRASGSLFELIVTIGLSMLFMAVWCFILRDWFLPIFGCTILVIARCFYKMGELVGDSLGEPETKQIKMDRGDNPQNDE